MEQDRIDVSGAVDDPRLDRSAVRSDRRGKVGGVLDGEPLIGVSMGDVDRPAVEAEAGNPRKALLEKR